MFCLNAKLHELLNQEFRQGREMDNFKSSNYIGVEMKQIWYELFKILLQIGYRGRNKVINIFKQRKVFCKDYLPWQAYLKG